MRLFFEPRSVVLIGVSRQTGSGAYNNLEMKLRYGYEGRIYPVHPKVPEILGHKTYARVADLPEIPDLAVISVGRDRVLPVFADCVEKGVRRVIVISQGFSDADEPGREMQEKLTKMAQENGVRVLGPNTMGVLNAFAGFSTAFVDIKRNPDPPPLALVVQSGVLQVGHECFTNSFGKAIDLGNTCDVDFIDVLEYLEHDPQTRVIVLHMEGMKRGRDFLRVAARIAGTKPILVLKTGRSAAGAQAALSHSGSLVGEDAVFDAAFAGAGLIRVHNMIELRAASRAFLHFESMEGPRLAVVTATGAGGIMTADACEDYGLQLAPFPEKIREDLEDPHIAWHKLRNPVDVWPLGMVGGSFTDIFVRAIRGMLADDQVDAVLGIAPALGPPLHSDLDIISSVKSLQESDRKRKPVALWLYGGGQADQCRALGNECGIACFGSIDEAVMGLAALWRFKKYQEDKREHEGLPNLFEAAEKGTGPSILKGVLVGESAFSVLGNYGIPVVPGKLTQDADSACAVAGEIAYPVVLKIISPEWLHKSDLGGIQLDVMDEQGLRSSYAKLKHLFTSKTPSGTLEGILVQKQIEGSELLMGIKRDPQFGPVLVVGMGGIYTEIFKDVVREIAPVSHARAEGMLEALRIYPILRGIRGSEGVHMESLVEMFACLSRLAMEHPEISELDLNPVIADSHGCWCVDCRIVAD